MRKDKDGMGRWKWLSRKVISSWLLQTAILDPDLLKGRPVLHTREAKPEEDFNFLQAKNCDPGALCDILGMVFRLKDLVPDLRPRKLDQAADHVLRALMEMLTVVPSSPITFVSKDGIRTIKGTAGEPNVATELASPLISVIDKYGLYAKSIRRGMWPRRDRLEGICNLLPVVYVKKQSGQPYFERVARLLDWVGIATSPRALASDYRDAAAQSGHPQFRDGSLLWLEFLLAMMEIDRKEAMAMGTGPSLPQQSPALQAAGPKFGPLSGIFQVSAGL